MALSDYKITEAQINQNGVISAPDILTGTPDENKKVFDKLIRQIVATAVNNLIDALSGSDAASEIPISNIDGLDAQTVQQAIAEIYQGFNDYISLIAGNEGASKVGVNTIDGVSGSNVQQALQSIKGIIDSMEAGTLPDGAVTSALIANGAVTEEKLESGLAAQIAVLGGATTPQETLANLGAGVARNELLNTRFLVNQRGQDSYTGNGVEPVTFDCWKAGLHTTISKSGENIVVSASGGEGYILQRIENPILEKPLVFSVLTTSGLYECKGVVNSSATIMKSTPFGSIGVTHGARMYVLIKVSDGQSVTLPTQNGDVVKLEVGSTQTLAYKDSDGELHQLSQPESDYATQLAKCQRYFRRFPALYALGVLMNAAQPPYATFIYDCNPPMRTNPVLSMQNQSDLTDAIDDGLSAVTPTEVVLGWISSENSVGFYFKGASVSGGPGLTCNRYIDASAEL